MCVLECVCARARVCTTCISVMGDGMWPLLFLQTVPMAMVSDFLLHDETPDFTSGSGAVLVIIGFIMVNALLLE